jgi:isocitrate dehydrogenase kinase/phosphatase
MRRRFFAKRQAALIRGYRSGLEADISKVLAENNVDGEYEQHTIAYTVPATEHTYTPDFRLPNGIFVETKGRFVLEDRKKHVLIKQQHPELDIRFVFQNSKNKIRKGSKTTYADWCNKHGFLYADKTIPQEWLA